MSVGQANANSASALASALRGALGAPHSPADDWMEVGRCFVMDAVDHLDRVSDLEKGLAEWRTLALSLQGPAAELRNVKERLGLTDLDADAAAVVDMLKSWEADANRRADRLAQHLRNVLEIARTWQPDYATKMDRDTLDFAAAEAEKAR